MINTTFEDNIKVQLAKRIELRMPFAKKIFDKIKENANVSHVDFSVTRYENDTPFIVMVVPKDRPRTNKSNQKQTNHKRSN